MEYKGHNGDGIGKDSASLQLNIPLCPLCFLRVLCAPILAIITSGSHSVIPLAFLIDKIPFEYQAATT
jgi:hypothetical protein